MATGLGGLGEENDEVVVDVVDLYCKVRNLGKRVGKEWEHDICCTSSSICTLTMTFASGAAHHCHFVDASVNCRSFCSMISPLLKSNGLSSEATASALSSKNFNRDISFA
jgi:hypothetical protein